MTNSLFGSRLWALVFIVAVGLFQPATASACGWDVFTPNRAGGFYGVAALSPTSLWVVGNRNPSPTTHRSLTEHWNGTMWSVVPSPDAGLKDGLFSNAIVAANDMWAVGNVNKAGLVQPLIEHWNGTSWSIVPGPSFSDYATLIEVNAVASSNVWAVGFFRATDQHYHPLVEHWNGSSWSVFSTPVVPNVDNFFDDVAVASPTSIWAVGYTFDTAGNYRTLTQHWNGGAWSIVPSANGPSDTLMNGVTAPLPNDVWATGQYVGSDGIDHTLAEHWSGSSWAIVPTPDFNNIGNLFDYVASSGPRDVWATGAYLTSDNLFHTLVAHFNGTAWTIVPSPLTTSIVNWRNDVKTFAPNDAFVVGSFNGADGIMHPFAEHYHC